MTGFWEKVLRIKPHDTEEASRQIAESAQQYAEVASRDAKIARLSDWFQARQEKNHFTDDVEITFRRRRHA